MKDLILLCTENVHWKFDNEIYKWLRFYGFSTRPSLSRDYSHWTRKIYGTKIAGKDMWMAFVKVESVTFLLEQLNTARIYSLLTN